MEQRIYDIFEEAQKSVGAHRSMVKKLVELVKEDRAAAMKVILRGCMDRILIFTKKEPAAERIVKFLCNFLVSTDDETFREGIEHLLIRSMGVDKTTRFRACQMIATSLNEMNTEAELAQDLWMTMSQVLTARLRDRAPNVRLWAVQAVGRLQNPEDPEDLIIAGLLRCMGTDPSTEIRVASLQTICICTQSLAYIVERIRDIKAEVRIAALKALVKGNVNVKHLNASLRAQVIQYGLNDRDANVRNVARELILAWLIGLKCNVAKLFHLLNLHSSKYDTLLVSEHCQMVGWSIMHEIDNGTLANGDVRTAARDQCPTWDSGFVGLTSADVLWAVIRCEYARQCFSAGNASEMCSALVPDTVRLCELLYEAHGTNLTGDEIVGTNLKLRTSQQQQLTVTLILRLATTKLIDSGADVEGSKQLGDCCRRLLSDPYLPATLVEPLLKAMPGQPSVVLTNTAGLCLQLYEQIRESCLLDQSMDLTEEEQHEKDDEQEYTIIRAMEIASWVFKRTVGVADSVSLGTNVANVVKTMTPMIWESLQQPVPQLRALAVRCLGILGTGSAAMNAKKPVEAESGEVPLMLERDIILEVSVNDVEEVSIRCAAIQALGDIAAVGNMCQIASERTDAEKIFASKFVTSLLALCQSGIESLVCVASEVAAKLFLNGTLSDKNLFAHLFRTFYEPSLVFGTSDKSARPTDGDDELHDSRAVMGSQAHLQQTLSIFFSTFTSAAGNAVDVTKREQLALDSISDVIGNVVQHVCSGAASTTLSRCCAGLSSMADTIAEGKAAVSGASSSGHSSCNVRAEFSTVMSACLIREALKLGSGDGDKSVSKAISSVLTALSPSSWVANLNASRGMQIGRASFAILKTIPLDKNGEKLFTEMTELVAPLVITTADADAGHEEEDSLDYFSRYAPGLMQLIELFGVTAEEEAAVALREISQRIQTAVHLAGGVGPTPSKRAAPKSAVKLKAAPKTTKSSKSKTDTDTATTTKAHSKAKTIVESSEDEDSDSAIDDVENVDNDTVSENLENKKQNEVVVEEKSEKVVKPDSKTTKNAVSKKSAIPKATKVAAPKEKVVKEKKVAVTTAPAATVSSRRGLGRASKTAASSKILNQMESESC